MTHLQIILLSILIMGSETLIGIFHIFFEKSSEGQTPIYTYHRVDYATGKIQEVGYTKDELIRLRRTVLKDSFIALCKLEQKEIAFKGLLKIFDFSHPRRVDFWQPLFLEQHNLKSPYYIDLGLEARLRLNLQYFPFPNLYLVQEAGVIKIAPDTLKVIEGSQIPFNKIDFKTRFGALLIERILKNTFKLRKYRKVNTHPREIQITLTSTENYLLQILRKARTRHFIKYPARVYNYPP